MKKIIVSLALSMLVCTGSTFAGNGGVPATVSNVFNEKFANAKDVIWETGKDFYKAAFERRGGTVFVYFADNGDIMGIAGNLSPLRLPEKQHKRHSPPRADNVARIAGRRFPFGLAANRSQIGTLHSFPRSRCHTWAQ